MLTVPECVFRRLRCALLAVVGLAVGMGVPTTQAAEMSDVIMEVPEPFRGKIENAIASVVSSARIEDDGDVAQLLRRIRPVVRDSMGTEGYFAPRITRLQPELQDLKLRFKIEPGDQVIVTAVDIRFSGAIADGSDDSKERINTLMDAWALPKGQPFKQKNWAQSKQALLNLLSVKDFAAAVMTSSHADIDPEAKSARLVVEYDSGPRFTLGALEVDGLKKYPANLVARFISIVPGEPYDQDKLLGLQADLQNTAYFSSVSVDIDADPEHHEQVPVHVKVIESQTRRLGFGAGISSNTGLRTEVSYRNQNVLDKAYSSVSGIRLEQRRQTVYTDLFLPPKRKGITDSIGASFDRLDAQGLITQRAAVGAIRRQIINNKEWQYGINYQTEDRFAEGQISSVVNALTLSGAWTLRAVDDLFNPSKGYVLTLQAAGASRNVLSEQNFVRLYGRVQRYWSFGSTHLLTARAELGTVISPGREGIPQEFLFRAGGTNSVRGLPYLGLGIQEAGATVGGRRLAIGSVEYTQWINGNIGGAVFIDAGGVSESWQGMRITPAIGFGPRYKTPAGAVAVDIASARGQRGPRLHFSLGVAF